MDFEPHVDGECEYILHRLRRRSDLTVPPLLGNLTPLHCHEPGDVAMGRLVPKAGDGDLGNVKAELNGEVVWMRPVRVCAEHFYDVTEMNLLQLAVRNGTISFVDGVDFDEE